MCSIDSASTSREGNCTRQFIQAWRSLCARVCHDDRIWQTPFVTVLNDSQASPRRVFEICATWALNMIPGSYRFPAYVASLAGRSELDVVRHALLENAWDESGGGHHKSRSHYWLAVRLARLLGLSETEIDRVVPLDSARAYMDEHYRHCVGGDFEVALGMICLIEEFTTPEFSLIFKAMLATCNAGLGIAPDLFVLNGGAEYFTANIADDERHREEMPRVVAAKLASRGVDLGDPVFIENELSRIAEGMEKSIRLREKFFEGIYDFVEAGGTYRNLVAP